MKKLMGLAIVGSLFCAPAAMAQQGALDALLGPQGVVQGLVATLTTADFNPLINGAASDMQTGTAQGNIATPLDLTLTSLLVNQDAGGVAQGLQDTLTVTVSALASGLGGGAILGGGAAGGIPGLGALPGLDALPTLPGL